MAPQKNLMPSLAADNSKAKAVVGNFTCSEDLTETLSQSITNFKARAEATGPLVGDMEGLMDRIAEEQLAICTL